MPTSNDLLFGKIAVKNRLVAEGQVKECLALLEKGGDKKALGHVLVEKGYLTAKHYQAISSHIKKLDADGAGNGRGARAPKVDPKLPPPSGPGIAAAEVAQKDYSSLAGQPIDLYLKEARRVGASDVHFQVDSAPYFRLHGEMVYLKHPVLTPEETEPRIFELLDDREQKILTEHRDLDFAYEADHGRYRANACHQRKGYDAVFRVIPEEVPSLESLHLPKVLERFTEYRHGIVLLTGPGGCGKTSTMAALVDIINAKQYDHIVTVEDPIEYIIESKNCNVNQRHVRVHTQSFATALRSAMRADPDYICVGEMRDLETVSMAITAAETGHLVLGTLNTTNAVRSVDRIIDIFPPKEQEQIRSMVSESLRGVISQQLLPRVDGRGREPALEVLFATSAVRNMVRERKTFQLASVIQTGAKQGMVAMDDSIADLVRRKLVTMETAARFAENPDRFR